MISLEVGVDAKNNAGALGSYPFGNTVGGGRVSETLLTELRSTVKFVIADMFAPV